MISQTSKYAPLILSYLENVRGKWSISNVISHETNIPLNYLLKILNYLTKKGIVRRQKGWGGGFKLNNRARDTKINSIIEIFDGYRDYSECIFGLKNCAPKDQCPLHNQWTTIKNDWLNTINDEKTSDLKPLHTLQMRKSN